VLLKRQSPSQQTMSASAHDQTAVEQKLNYNKTKRAVARLENPLCLHAQKHCITKSLCMSAHKMDAQLVNKAQTQTFAPKSNVHRPTWPARTETENPEVTHCDVHASTRHSNSWDRSSPKTGLFDLLGGFWKFCKSTTLENHWFVFFWH